MADHDHIESLIEAARDAHAAGDYDRAVDCCTEAIEINPSQLKATFTRALVYQTAQKHDEAIADCTTVATASDTSSVKVAALYSRAVSHHAIGDLQNTSDDCHAVLEIDPKHPDARYLYCVALKALGQIDRAIESANRLVDDQPQFQKAIYIRATLHHMNADWPAAIHDFTAYLELTDASDQFQHSAYFLRGVSHHYNDSNEEALADLNRALEIQPDHPSSLARRALVYTALGQQDKSAADIARSKELLN